MNNTFQSLCLSPVRECTVILNANPVSLNRAVFSPSHGLKLLPERPVGLRRCREHSLLLIPGVFQVISMELQTSLWIDRITSEDILLPCLKSLIGSKLG
ncbi:hypothetical protein EK904_003314 [Melospiza melodia maxima]|nr:hypothetical protein EK904_003314 [Melospiza melodia maxima]